MEPVEGVKAQFIHQLNQLYEQAGRPTLVSLQGENAVWLARSSVSKLLNGKFDRTPPWERIEAFVIACVKIGKSKNLRMSPQDVLLEQWRHHYEFLAIVLDQASRRSLVSTSDDRAITLEPTRRRRFGAVPPRADSFQHRAAAEVLKRAGERGGAATTQVSVLTGLSGVGKTQLAADHAHTVWDSRQVGLVAWISARTRTAITAAYTEIAVELLGQNPAAPERAWRRLREWLADTSTRWLIVLDDLRDPADLEGLWPPPNGGGQVVVTTRGRNAAPHGDRRHIVDIGTFTSSEALACLVEGLPARAGDTVQLSKLAEDLGFLPLALAQAVAYLTDKPLHATADYRTMLSDRKTMLGQKPPQAGTVPEEHEQTVAAIGSLSIAAADQLAPDGLARPLLELTALLDPAGIPIPVFTSDAVVTHLEARLNRGVTADSIVQGLDCMRRFSLLTVDPEQPHCGVRVHTLVQRAIRDTLTPDMCGSLARAAADALNETWPDIETDQELVQALRSNADALQDIAEDHLFRPGGHPVLFRLAQSLGNAQLLDAAATVTKKLHHRTTIRPRDLDNSRAGETVRANNRLRAPWKFQPASTILRRDTSHGGWPRWRAAASVAVVAGAVLIAPWQAARQPSAPTATSAVANRIVHADTRDTTYFFGRDVSRRPIRARVVAGTESPAVWTNIGDVVLASDPVAFRKGEGNIIGLFGRAASGELMYSYIDDKSVGPNSWFRIGSAVIAGTPSVIYRSSGNMIDVFARDVAGRLLHARAADASPNWSNLKVVNDAPIATDPVAIYNSVDDVIEVFARNKADYLVHVRSDGAGRWSGWNTIGNAPIIGTPSVVYKEKNNVTEVFARNRGNMPVHAYISADSNGWTRWYGITDWEGAYDIPLSSDLVSVYKLSSNATEIFALDSEGHVVHSYLLNNTNRFSFWTGIGGRTFSDQPGATYTEAGNLTELFGRDSTGAPVHAYAIGTSANWTDWLAVGDVKLAPARQN
ncbi:NB-ARC domain-containing protein [Amycolatopsis japonica]